MEWLESNWMWVVSYVVLGWVAGVVLFCLAFMHRDVSMGGNSGGNPLHYFRVDMPSIGQAVAFVFGVAVWPLTLAAVAIGVVVCVIKYALESENRVFPRIVKWVFGWPVFAVLYLCEQCVEHEK